MHKIYKQIFVYTQEGFVQNCSIAINGIHAPLTFHKFKSKSWLDKRTEWVIDQKFSDHKKDMKKEDRVYD